MTATFITDALLEKLASTGEAGSIEALIVVLAGQDLLAEDDGGLVHRVIEAAASRTGEVPAAVRCFPRANAVVITASARLIREILSDEHTAIACTTDLKIYLGNPLPVHGVSPH